jgi:hypothetical protein
MTRSAWPPVLVCAMTIVLAIADCAAAGKTWVVDQRQPQAIDQGPASESIPLKTISAAASRAAPGDTILVREGVYRERVIPARGGEEDQPITYTAAPGEKVVLRGSEVWQPDWQAVDEHPGVFRGEFGPGFLPRTGLTWANAPANDVSQGGGPFDTTTKTGGGVDPPFSAPSGCITSISRSAALPVTA